MKRDLQRVYRFALYGRSGSGKTCLLATMAMGTAGYPRGLSCERMPVISPAPAGGRNTPVAAMHTGKAWMDEALDALRSGRRAKANPPSFDGAPATVRFQIGSPTRGDFLLETVDYSGELLHPGEEHRDDSHVSAIKQCLAQFDGFLILAETPRSGDDQNLLSDELRLLRESFASLRDSQSSSVDTPVAVVMTKWDRWSDVDFTLPDRETKKLRDFLSKHPAQHSLGETIGNALIGQPSVEPNSTVGIFYGNCPMFPATAFGRAVEMDGFESPIPGEQRPFGILEPFLWLADRRDSLDAARLVQDWKDWRWHVLWPWYWIRLFRLSGRAKRCLARMAPPSAAAALTDAIRRKALWSVAFFAVAWFALSLCTAGIGYDAYQAIQFRAAAAKLDDPTTRDSALLELRSWFDRYSRGWNGPLFSPPCEMALGFVARVDAILEDRYWLPVTDVELPAAKYEAAKAYLTALENGLHAAECRKIVEDHESIAARQKNADWLARRQRESETILTETEMAALQQTLRQGLPDPVFASPEQNDQLCELSTDIAAKLAVLTREREWQRFIASYSDALKAGDPVAASRLLSARDFRDDAWEELVRQFPAELEQVVARSVSKHLQDHRFTEAQAAIEAGLRALKDLEAVLRTDASILVDGLLEGQRLLQPHGRRVALQYDQYLYGLVKDQGDPARLDDYLAHAPLQTMADRVRAYRRYLDAMSGPLDVDIEVKIKWDKAYNLGSNNMVIVYLNDEPVLKQAKVAPAAGELSGVIGRFRVSNQRLDESAKFRIVVQEKDLIWHDDAGQGTRTIKFRDLVQGASFDLIPANASPLKNEARLNIARDQLPLEPELPPWKEP